MFVIAMHDISDPKGFWDAAREYSDPEGFHLEYTIASPDGTRAICLWQAESPEAVKRLLDGAYGSLMSTRCFEADDRLVADAGLPSGLRLVSHTV